MGGSLAEGRAARAQGVRDISARHVRVPIHASTPDTPRPAPIINKGRNTLKTHIQRLTLHLPIK